MTPDQTSSLPRAFAACMYNIRKFYEGKIEIIFLSIDLNMCLGCSKEPSQ